MKNRKNNTIRIIALTLIMNLFVNILCGCGNLGKLENLGNLPEKSTFNDEKKHYIIAVEPDNAPYYHIDKNGKCEGWYVELMDRISEEENFTYEFSEMDITDYIGLKDTSAADCYMGIFYEEAGDQSLIYTDPFFESEICVVADDFGSNKVEELKELRSRNVAARSFSGEKAYADYLAYKYEVIPVEFTNEKNAMEDYAYGLSKAFVTDKYYYENNAFEGMRAFLTSQLYFNEHVFAFSAENELYGIFENNIGSCKKHFRKYVSEWEKAVKEG